MIAQKHTTRIGTGIKRDTGSLKIFRGVGKTWNRERCDAWRNEWEEKVRKTKMVRNSKQHDHEIGCQKVGHIEEC